jgi:hypothetical protein
MATAEEWLETLDEVTRERLARECRARITVKDLKGALHCVAALVERAEGDTDAVKQSAMLIVRALGDMIQDRERVETLLGMMRKSGGTLAALHPAIEPRVQEMLDRGASAYTESNRVWLQNFIEAVVKLQEYLPGQNEVGEPSEAQLGVFLEEARKILKAGMARRRPDDMVDALKILTEYCPADPVRIKNVAGAEDRMFIQLGPKAKLTAVRAMRQLGESESLRKVVMKLAEGAEEAGPDRVKMVLAIMGGLGHAEFCPYLCKQMKKAANPIAESWVLDALSRQQEIEAADAILGFLERLIRRSTEKFYHERIENTLAALGRFTRLKGIDVAARQRIVGKAVSLLEHGDRQVQSMGAERLFTNRLEELGPELLDWAARICVASMWSQPRHSIGVASAGQTNGWREPLVRTLVRLGPGTLDAMKDAATSQSMVYSGAMGALANVFAEIGDESCVPMLEGMIRTALLHNEDATPNHLREQVMDVGSHTPKSLDRDDMIDTMVRALIQIGGEPGRQVALGLADQIQSGRVPNPGGKTSAVLLDFKMKHGGDIQKPAVKAEARVEVSERELKGLIGDAKGGLLTKLPKQIMAIAQLGQTRDPKAVPALMELLGHKEPMVASAAHTALAQFVQPLPGEFDYSEFLDKIFEQQKLLKGVVLERLLEFIRAEIPKNPPYDKLFKKSLEIGLDDEALLHQFRAAARKVEKKPVQENGAEGGEPEGGAQGDDPLGSAHRTELDRKRDFLLRRKEWVANGRKGPEPKMED